MTINEFIKKNNLQPADAIELALPSAGIIKHYAIYLGMENNLPRFIANITDGIQLIEKALLGEFIKKYEVTAIEKFVGSTWQRKAAIKKAMSRIGEKAYNLVFNNCEHFKNWVLHGYSSSKQVTAIGGGILFSGAALTIFGAATNDKKLQKAGLIILGILVAIILLAIMWANRNDDAINTKSIE
jgi:Lecithin retinol acyltransferase